MVKYVEGFFDRDYNETIGVQFLEKKLNAAGTNVIMSLWDLGGAKKFTTMLPMVCVDAVAMLFLFDLTNEGSLDSVREWYRQVRTLNPVRFTLPAARARHCRTPPRRPPRHRPACPCWWAPSLTCSTPRRTL